MTLYVLAISHRHGVDSWLFSTEQKAYDALDDYIQYWWDTELDGDPMPSSPGARREQYFAKVFYEDYSIDMRLVDENPVYE